MTLSQKFNEITRIWGFVPVSIPFNATTNSHKSQPKYCNDKNKIEFNRVTIGPFAASRQRPSCQVICKEYADQDNWKLFRFVLSYRRENGKTI
jgi:hypothetical protein